MIKLLRKKKHGKINNAYLFDAYGIELIVIPDENNFIRVAAPHENLIKIINIYADKNKIRPKRKAEELLMDELERSILSYKKKTKRK